MIFSASKDEYQRFKDAHSSALTSAGVVKRLVEIRGRHYVVLAVEQIDGEESLILRRVERFMQYPNMEQVWSWGRPLQYGQLIPEDKVSHMTFFWNTEQWVICPVDRRKDTVLEVICE